MSPLQLLRESLSGILVPKEMSTQAGFARYVGKSESLVRAIEGGRVPVSRKFARELSERFGLPSEWFMNDKVSEADSLKVREALEKLANAGLPAVYPTSKSDVGAPTSLWGNIRMCFAPPQEGMQRQLVLKRVWIRDTVQEIEGLLNACNSDELGICIGELREFAHSWMERLLKAGDASGGPDTDVVDKDHRVAMKVEAPLEVVRTPAKKKSKPQGRLPAPG